MLEVSIRHRDICVIGEKQCPAFIVPPTNDVYESTGVDGDVLGVVEGESTACTEWLRLIEDRVSHSDRTKGIFVHTYAASRLCYGPKTFNTSEGCSDIASQGDCTACKIERTESYQRQIGQGEAKQRKIIGAVDVDQPIGCNGIM